MNLNRIGPRISPAPKNAILPIDFTETLRQHGLARTGAFLEAGYARLRPIGMTTATVVFGMLPPRTDARA